MVDKKTPSNDAHSKSVQDEKMWGCGVDSNRLDQLKIINDDTY